MNLLKLSMTPYTITTLNVQGTRNTIEQALAADNVRELRVYKP